MPLVANLKRYAVVGGFKFKAIPAIAVSDISKKLISLRKVMLRDRFATKEQKEWIDLTFIQIRRQLQLRKRARQQCP